MGELEKMLQAPWDTGQHASIMENVIFTQRESSEPTFHRRLNHGYIPSEGSMYL